MKFLYEFSLNKEIEKDKVETSTNEAGETVSVTKKVKERTPFQFALRRPNRELRNDATLYRGSQYNLAIQKGLIPLALLNKRFYSDENNITTISEIEKKKYTELSLALSDKQNELSVIIIKKDEDRTPEEKEKRKELLTEISFMNNMIQEWESSRVNVYNQTAEVYANNQLLTFWVLSLAYFKNEKNEWEPYFGGNDLKSKQEKYDDIDESDGRDFDKKATAFFTALTVFWNNYSAQIEITKEHFDTFFKQISQEENVEPNTTGTA